MLSKTSLGTLLTHYWEVFKMAWEHRHFDDRQLSELYESEFLPDAIELQETSSSPALKWISYLLIIMLAIGLVWAIIGKVDIVAIANGRLISSGHTKIIQSLSTAKVKAIYIQNGQHVKKGQILIQLDDTEAIASIQKLNLLIPLLTKKKNSYKSLLADEYVSEHDYFDKQKELLEAIAQLKQAEFNANSMAITSPIDGVVSNLNLYTIGGVVTPGQNLLMIVPAVDEIVLDAYLNNKDIGFVKTGQEVAIKLEAFPYTRYGLVKGTIRTISHDSIEKQGEKPVKTKESDLDEKAQTSNNYQILVGLDQSSIFIDGENIKLTPGMVASAEIKTGKRSLINYLLSPLVENISEAARER